MPLSRPAGEGSRRRSRRRPHRPIHPMHGRVANSQFCKAAASDTPRSSAAERRSPPRSALRFRWWRHDARTGNFASFLSARPRPSGRSTPRLNRSAVAPTHRSGRARAAAAAASSMGRSGADRRADPRPRDPARPRPARSRRAAGRQRCLRRDPSPRSGVLGNSRRYGVEPRAGLRGLPLDTAGRAAASGAAPAPRLIAATRCAALARMSM